jgi:enolase
LVQAIETGGYKPGQDVFIGIDAAASELYQNGAYTLTREGRTLSASQMIDLYAEWIADYPIISLEDGLAEDDWQGWAELTQRLGSKVQLVGDDIFVRSAR